MSSPHGPWDVIVVGAGHNGLAAAFYLAQAGYKTLVVEAQPHLGGACLTQELIPGFRFSTCASYLQALRPEIIRDMRLVERGLEIPRQRHAAHLFPDGRRLVFHFDDLEQTQSEIARFSKRDAASYPRWLDFVAEAGRVLGPYIMQSPPRLSEVFDAYRGTRTEDVLSTLVTHSLAEIQDLFFESDEVCVALSAPLDTGSYWNTASGLSFAILVAMRYYAGPAGLPPSGFPRGGMGRLAELMAAAARDMGVEIRPRSPVRRILVDGGRVGGVELHDGEQMLATTVVSNADPKRTLLGLVEPGTLDSDLVSRVRRLRTNHGCLKFHAAVSELPRYSALEGLDTVEMAAGCVRICPSRAYLDRSWREAMRGKLPTAPQIELFTPSVDDDSLAPAGRHTVSCWIEYAPYRLRVGSWDEHREAMAQRLIDIIDAYAPNFRASLIGHQLLTPLDFERDRLMTAGNIHHVDIIPSQMLAARPLPELSGYRAPLKGLYLCGAGMHPWGEVTGAPGHNAAQAVIGDLGGAANT